MVKKKRAKSSEKIKKKSKSRFKRFRKIFKIKAGKAAKRKPKAVKSKIIKKRIVKLNVKKRVVRIKRQPKSVKRTAVKKVKWVKKPIKGKAVKLKKVKPIKKALKKPKEKPLSFLEDQHFYEYLMDLVGEEGMKVVKKISAKEISDVELAERMDLKANIIRKHLYRLYEAGVVTYRRHRSKTGWYTYYWKIHPDRINTAIATGKETEVKELMEMLEYERNNQFYRCKKKCTKAVFDDAMEQGFKCPKCDKSLEFFDNNRRVTELENQINNLKGF